MLGSFGTYRGIGGMRGRSFGPSGGAGSRRISNEDYSRSILRQPVRGRPPLDDEHRGLLVEVGVHDLSDVGVEEVPSGPAVVDPA